MTDCTCQEHQRIAALEREVGEARHHVKVLQGWVHSDICSGNCVEGCAEAWSWLARHPNKEQRQGGGLS